MIARNRTTPHNPADFVPLHILLCISSMGHGHTPRHSRMVATHADKGLSCLHEEQTRVPRQKTIEDGRFCAQTAEFSRPCDESPCRMYGPPRSRTKTGALHSNMSPWYLVWATGVRALTGYFGEMFFPQESWVSKCTGSYCLFCQLVAHIWSTKAVSG